MRFASPPTTCALRLWACLLLSPIQLLAADDPPITPAQREFFENRIRPILAQDCYECHRSTAGGKRRGGLALDHREALREGGDSGAVIIPGKPSESLLIRAIKHESNDLKMPKAGAQLEKEIVADFEAWITMGAPDPRDEPPSDELLASDTNWNAIMERRKRWWSFQPISDPAIDSTEHGVDQLIAHRLRSEGLEPASQASPEALIRRLSFVLRGLPPTPEEIQDFRQDPTDSAYAALVDEFLDSPRFGERWARHWMDWVRYADSHGSEGDPNIPYAWRYRDYLIRALNADVPYDQLAKEHVAGDLLVKPRTNPETGLNESAIGPAHLRMVFHGFAPTDALDERVRFTDDQINVVSKSFLGLTVSCARCHHHKFDPISQDDFYSWYGIFSSATPASITIDLPNKSTVRTREEMANQKQKIRAALIRDWLAQLEDIGERLAQPDEVLAEAIGGANDARHPLHPLKKFKEEGTEAARQVLLDWKMLETPSLSKAIKSQWNLGKTSELQEWNHEGPSLDSPSPEGSFAVITEGEAAVAGIYPGGVYSHITSEKDRGFLTSPRIDLDGEYELWMQVAGNGGAVMRYVVQHYPRDGTVYPVGRLNDGRWRWQRYQLGYWNGDQIHVELSTAADQAILANTGRARSWFGVRQVLITPKGQGAPTELDSIQLIQPLLEQAGRDLPLPTVYLMAIETALAAWSQDALTDAQALFLNEMLRIGLLPNALDRLPGTAPLVASYRELEASLPVPTRVPGLAEKDAYDQALFVRGNHKQPDKPIARRFLDAIDSTPYEVGPRESGRLALANDLFRPDNPLTARVIVNRLWHHTFGEGLVRTPDNFGRLGEEPSHPDLLDHLAQRFVSGNYSIKSLIRYLVTSNTWKASSTPPTGAEAKDPDNRLLSHAHVRRLEAEAIRDSLLAVSGRLDEDAMFGSPADNNSPKRSVYLRVKRNNLNPFLTTFDSPVPASTKGRRDVTNVPGQSLTLLNDPFVIDLAHAWSENLNETPDSERLDNMFLQALGRGPSREEARAAEQFLQRSLGERKQIEAALKDHQKALSKTENNLNTLVENVKKRILSEREKNSQSANNQTLVEPIAHWSFDSDLRDQLGELHGAAHGSARIENGHLLLDGKRGTYVSSSPLQERLGEKTLEAWVQLEDLGQTGGGVMTVQDLRGVRFDSIVIGERERGHWLAGSDNHSRTESFGGESEREAQEQFVHLAFVYHSDGKVTGYRQGKPYGKAFKSDGPMPFEAGEAQILFGNRHGSADGDRLLRGKIDRASLYDRALSPEEIAASFSGDPNYVSRNDVETAMTEAEREKEALWKRTADTHRDAIASLEASGGAPSGWADLAHAMFNLKEFIFIR